MDISIEGQVISIQLEEEKKTTLAQIMMEVEDYLITLKKIPVVVRLNGVPYNTDSERTQAETCMIGQNDKIEVESITLESFMLAQLTNISVAQEHLVVGIQNFATAIEQRQGVAKEGSILEELKGFFEFWTTLYRIFPEVAEKVAFEQQHFPEWLASLSKKLNQVVEALQKPDYILAADLMRYEFIPALQIIKFFIPKFQELMKEQDEQRQTVSVTPSTEADV